MEQPQLLERSLAGVVLELRDVRHEQKLSQESLAARSDSTQQLFSLLEDAADSGVVSLQRWVTIRRYASGLGLDEVTLIQMLRNYASLLNRN